MIETAIFTSADGDGTRWRLLSASHTAARPRQYARLKFDVAGGQVIGCLVLWGTEEEVPLEDLRFDGMHLWLRLPARFLPEHGPEKAALLSLTVFGDREFRGYYVDESGERVEPAHEFKLVRGADEVTAL